MPSFAKSVSAEDAMEAQAYILDRAWLGPGLTEKLLDFAF